MSNVKAELLKLATQSETRKDEISKLAGGRMDRNYASKERRKAIKDHDKARKLYSDLSSQLGDLQSRVQKAEEDMNASKDHMIDLNKIIQVMDLIGASDFKKEKDGDCSYTVDGNKCYADTTDFMNIRVVPWSEYKESLKAKDSEDSEEPEESEEDCVDCGDKDYANDLIQEMHVAREYSDPLAFIPTEEDEGYAYANVESNLITKVAKKRFR